MKNKKFNKNNLKTKQQRFGICTTNKDMQFAPFIINEFFMRSLFNLLDRNSNYNFIKEFKQKQFHLSVFEN